MSGGNSVSRGEFRVEGGIPCRGGIPCHGGNSESRGEFRVDGIPWTHQLYILLKKTFKSVFTINIGFFRFFQKCFSGLADFRDLLSLAISGPSFLEN